MAINWLPITSSDQIDQIKERSFEVPCLILKHSTRCGISSIAKYRLEDDWDFEPGAMEAYYMDVLTYRPVSLQLAEVFQVYHESPQVLLIIQGECVYDAAQLDISIKELHEGLAESRAIKIK